MELTTTTDELSYDVTNVEYAALGSAINDVACARYLFDRCKNNSIFTDLNNKDIYAVMLYLNNQKVALNPFIMRTELENRGIMPRIGGITAYNKLCAYKQKLEAFQGNIDYLLHKQADAYYETNMVEIVKRLYNSGNVMQMQYELGELDLRTRKMRPSMLNVSTFSEAFAEALQYSKDVHEGLIPIASTGIAAIDEQMCGGIRGGEICVFNARPKMGKTSIAVAAATEAIKKGQKVLFISLEMEAKDLAMKVASNLLDYDLGRLSMDYDANDAAFASKEVEKKVNNITFVYEREISPREIDNMLSEGGYGLVVLDYIQLVSDDKRKLDEFIKDFAIIIKKNRVPCIQLAQLKRDTPKVGCPETDNIANTDAIFRYASFSVAFYREQNDSQDFIWAKINGSRTRVAANNAEAVRLYFAGERSKFMSEFEYDTPKEQEKRAQKNQKIGVKLDNYPPPF